MKKKHEKAWKKLKKDVNWKTLAKHYKRLDHKWATLETFRVPNAEELEKECERMFTRLVEENLRFVSTGGLLVTKEDNGVSIYYQKYFGYGNL